MRKCCNTGKALDALVREAVVKEKNVVPPGVNAPGQRFYSGYVGFPGTSALWVGDMVEVSRENEVFIGCFHVGQGSLEDEDGL